MRRLGLGIAVSAACVAAVLPAPAANADGLETTCQFSLFRIDDTTTNVFAPDSNAFYWVGLMGGFPGTRVKIEGEFPHSRYMSFNTYTGMGRPTASISDTAIEPEPGSTNPFRPGADRNATKRDYKVFIEFTPKPANPEPNTIYAGEADDGSQNRGGVFVYRIYVPDDGRDRAGAGVPLPRTTIEGPGGNGMPPGLTDFCRTINAPFLDDVAELVRNQESLPVNDVLPNIPGRDPPDWRLFTNLSRSIVEQITRSDYGAPLAPVLDPLIPLLPITGLFQNRDISYVSAAINQGFGKVLAIRARKPTFPDTRGGAATYPDEQQLRYFSFCQHEPFAVQHTISCRNDDRIKEDSRGNFTLVVSTPANRPANARPECGVTWMPWGPFKHGLLIYRHMLAAPSFANAIQRIGEPGREREVMGEYYPDSEYYADKAAFEATGCSP